MVFRLDQEGEQKLWVGTPMPISRNVWARFIHNVFPDFSIQGPTEFQIVNAESSEKNWPSDSDIIRWNAVGYRYLSRRQNTSFGDDYTHKTVLRDGASGFPWTHAELPDDFRTGAKLDEWGLVYIPHPNQKNYVGQLMERLTPDKLGALESFNTQEDALIRGIFDVYGEALNLTEPSPNNIRRLLLNSSKFNSGYLPRQIGEPNYNPLASFNGLSHSQDFIVHQTQLGFLDIVDSRLALYPRNVPLTTNELTGLHELFSIYGDSLDRARRSSGRQRAA
jgi:hypothetical protein